MGYLLFVSLIEQRVGLSTIAIERLEPPVIGGDWQGLPLPRRDSEGGFLNLKLGFLEGRQLSTAQAPMWKKTGCYFVIYLPCPAFHGGRNENNRPTIFKSRQASSTFLLRRLRPCLRRNRPVSKTSHLCNIKRPDMYEKLALLLSCPSKACKSCKSAL
jgi:hypothetical protein